MSNEAAIVPETAMCIRTLRLKVKPEAYAWLNAAAIETNQVWNFANAASDKAARPFAGPGRWLSAFDLDSSPPERLSTSSGSGPIRFNGSMRNLPGAVTKWGVRNCVGARASVRMPR